MRLLPTRGLAFVMATTLVCPALLYPAKADPMPGMARMVDSPALQAAFAKAESGEVELMAELGDDGLVRGARILKSIPEGVFDEAAKAMVIGRKLQTLPVTSDRHITLRFVRPDSDRDAPALPLSPQ